MKKIRITLQKDGTTKIEVLGAVGEDCLELTRELERRLGAPVGERTLKDEFYETVADTIHDQNFEMEAGQ